MTMLNDFQSACYLATRRDLTPRWRWYRRRRLERDLQVVCSRADLARDRMARRPGPSLRTLLP